MSDFSEFEHGPGYYVEPPSVLARNLSFGARLWVATQVFFYGGFLFSFFYLRELNVNNMWHPAKVSAPVGQGIAVTALVVAAALVHRVALEGLRRRGEAAWRGGAALALLLALAAVIVQCYEWATLGFGAGDGAYASVFVAWTGFYLAFGLIAGMYWVETTLATSIRQRHHEPGLVVSAAEAPAGARGAAALIGPSAEAAGLNLSFLALIAIAMFVLLYIVG